MIAEEQDLDRIQVLRKRFRAWQAGVDPGRVFCIDETGLTIAMARTYARAPRGERVSDKVPRNRGTVTTIIGALTIDGLTAMMTVEGGTSGDVFLAYVLNILGPELRPGDFVVMDNLAAHKDPRVLAAIEARGAKAIFQPPYSPEVNPIELAWAWLKSFLRTARARDRRSLDLMVGWAMRMLNPTDAGGWFRHCGYLSQAL